MMNSKKGTDCFTPTLKEMLPAKLCIHDLLHSLLSIGISQVFNSPFYMYRYRCLSNFTLCFHYKTRGLLIPPLLIQIFVQLGREKFMRKQRNMENLSPKYLIF
ncbi:hypothetical protein LguiA_007384 [Lonicera macranthoides]